jgi:hypothetical protein
MGMMELHIPEPKQVPNLPNAKSALPSFKQLKRHGKVAVVT